MTTFAGPQDGGNMSQAQWEEVESKLWTDGVIAGARNAFATTTTSGLGLSVASGDAILDGFRFYADAATSLSAATADPSLPRIDLVVLRLDESAHTAAIAIKTGTPGSSPVAPSATKTVGGTYELGVCQVRVNAGATSITSLTDVRVYCGPASAVNKTGDTMTGELVITRTLSGSDLGFVRFLASDGKTYDIGVAAGGQFFIWNVTDGHDLLRVGASGSPLTLNSVAQPTTGSHSAGQPIISYGTGAPVSLDANEIYIQLS